ncbi:MAG: phage terminase large subunit [Aggregatilineales bacterium]
MTDVDISAMLALAIQNVQKQAAKTRPPSWGFRGAALAIQEMQDPEILVSGPAGTGKSLGILYKYHNVNMMYPGTRGLIVRKVRADIAKSALVTFEKHILGEDNPMVTNVKPEYRSVYRYPNGSLIAIGGMDRPTSVMSAEYDWIYVQEATELEEVDWESLTTRLRNNVVPWQQICGDANPDRPDHWIKRRCEEGRCTYLESWHEDNPAFVDEHGEFTEQGKRYILGVLENLTGVRYERLRLGKWVSAEGAIYTEYSESTHVVDRFDIPIHWTRFMAIDFGYTNPMVIQWWAMDGDGRLYLYRELYKTRHLVEDMAREARQRTGDERISWIVCDHDAEGRATFEKYFGMATISAHKEVLNGIQAVQTRFRVAGDRKARLFFFRDARMGIDVDLAEAKLPTSTLQEIGGYVWNDKKQKEEPVKADDHGMDCMRYGIMSVDYGRSSNVATVKARGLGGGRRMRGGRRG